MTFWQSFKASREEKVKKGESEEKRENISSGSSNCGREVIPDRQKQKGPRTTNGGSPSRMQFTLLLAKHDIGPIFRF